MAEIILLNGQQELRRYKLDGGDATIGRDVSVGRDPSNAIVIADPRVSRSHARFYLGAGGWHFEDKLSTHGSYVGAERVRERRLVDGDTIRVGDHALVFSSRDGATVPSRRVEAPAGPINDFRTMLLRPDAGDESSRRLKALFDITLTLETASDLPATLTLLMDKAIGIMGAERGFILMKDGPDAGLRVHVARDTTGAVSGLDAESISRSVVDKVVATGKAVLIENAQSQEWGTASIVAHGIHSALCVPMMTRQEVTGVIYVDHRQRPRAFNDEDLAFFTVFAVQAKSVIDLSRSYWELIESLFKASGDFIVLCSPQGRITQANHGAATLLEITESELGMRNFEDIVFPVDKERARALCRQTAEGQVISGLELTLAGADGKIVPMSVSSFAMRDRHGKAMGLCLIGRDLSEMRSLISRLTTANAKLQELNDMKSQFVGMIVHELKNPLSAVIGYARMIRDDRSTPVEERHKDFVGRILRAGDRLVNLITELLELTRIETGKITLRVEPLDLAAFLAETSESFSLQKEQAGVRTELTIPPGLPTLNGDRNLLRRAFDNLFSNGIKYNRPNGRVRVVVERQGDKCSIAFSDDGIGISEEDQKRLFERFFRAGAVRKIDGTGLGLSIVKAIIERHDGRLTVESVLERGTTFRIVLPFQFSGQETT